MRPKKAMSDIWLPLIIGIVVVIVVLSIANPSKLTNLFKKIILRQNVENNIQPEDTIYLCSDDSGRYSCVISDMKKTTDCRKEVKKYNFGYKDDWITCENEACLKNYPGLLTQATVYLVPLHKEHMDLTEPINMAKDNVKSYVHTLESCGEGSQISILEVDDCKVAETEVSNGIYCYDSKIYLQIAKCVQDKYSLGRSFLIFAIDNYVFTKAPCNYDAADKLITSFLIINQEYIIIQRSKMEAMSSSQWTELLQNSKLLGKSCIPVSDNEPLSKTYTQCDQHLLEGQKI